MYKRILSAGLLFGMAATAPPAYAQACALRLDMIEKLQSKFSESLTGAGLQVTGNDTLSLMEIWASADSGSFTVILTSPQGVSCIVAAGSDFFSVPLVKVPEGDAS